MKKTLLLLTTVLLSTASAFAQGGTTGPLTWNISGNTLTISGEGAMPEYIEIAQPWRAYHNSIYSVIMEIGVANIGSGAFDEFPNLTSVTIPNSVTTIGKWAFLACSSLVSITIPDGVTIIGEEAFSDCYSLTSITIPNSVTHIWRKAFSSCTSLPSVTIPNGIKNIGDNAFNNCRNLQTVNFNAVNCTTMGSLNDHVFSNCGSFTTLNIGNDVQNIPERAFQSCGNLSSVTIGDSVKTIARYAFSGCGSLTSITIPNSVRVIGQHAFEYCINLVSITILKGLSTIGDNAFKNCTSLTSITIPNSVTTIKEEIFSGCTNLTSITLPLTSVGICLGYLFYISNTQGPFTGYAYQGKFGSSHYFVPSSLKTVTVTDDAEIKVDFFKNTNITKIFAKYAAVNSAFTNCNLLDTLILGSITYMAKFQNLTALKSLAILDGDKTSFCSGFIQGCSSLADLTIPFVGTSSTNPTSLSTLFSSSVPIALKKLTLVRSSSNIQIADNALSGLAHLIEVTLSSNVRGLGEHALYGCNGLEHIYSHWANPPAAYNNNTFEGVNKYACTIHVPMGSKEKYATAAGWKEFYDIQEEAAVTIIARPVPLYGGIIDGTLQYNYDETAKITATGNMGYDFQCWIEDDSVVCTEREYTFLVEGPRILYAVFTPRENENGVTVTTSPTEAVIVWNGEPGASSYTLILYLDPERTQEYARFEFDEFGNPKAVISCTITNLTPDMHYYYTLTSYDKDNYKLNIYNGNFTAAFGIVETLRATPLRVYPNPTNGELTIDASTSSATNGELTIDNVEIFDIYGKKLSSHHLIPSSSNHLINISHLSAGIYFLKIGNETVKVVKQ